MTGNDLSLSREQRDKVPRAGALGRQRAPMGLAGGLAGVAMDLQRKAGNASTTRLLSAGQAKLAVSPAGDRYEREADAIAAEVVARLGAGAGAPSSPLGNAAGDEQAAGPVSVMARRGPRALGEPIGEGGGELSGPEEARLNAARRGGSQLPPALRRSMEGAFGADFSAVRVHSGEEAASLNESVGALAFTVGSDIFLGRPAPGFSTPSGQSLLAHELAHTVQQGASPARRVAAKSEPVEGPGAC
jgi:hypothetical protein